MLVLEWSYFSGEAHLGYHQDTHLGARGALSTLRVVSRSEKAVDKARKSMGKPACTIYGRFNVPPQFIVPRPPEPEHVPPTFVPPTLPNFYIY